jgi:hypothetical protein
MNLHGIYATGIKKLQSPDNRFKEASRVRRIFNSTLCEGLIKKSRRVSGISYSGNFE